MNQNDPVIRNFTDDKDIAGCAVSSIMNAAGERFSGQMIMDSICNMHDRSNGLGGGFAAYGVYPNYPDHWCFHMMYLDGHARYECEEYLRNHFEIDHAEVIPTRHTKNIHNAPILWRYFMRSEGHLPEGTNEEDYIVDIVMHINSEISNSYVFSSGKNMGVFKGVGYPEEIGEFFRLEEYEAYTWLSHGRFPTNTQGWWGGAHPFNLLNWSVVHNGELSSYGINQRYLEMFGYKCTLRTDTEVVAYTMDLLARRHKLPWELIASVIAPPLWNEIDRMDDKNKALYTSLRQIYGSLLLNGPFAFILAGHDTVVGVTDRIRLRPMVAGQKGDLYFMATEEAGIREVCPDVDRIWSPRGGEPIIIKIDHKKKRSAAAGSQRPAAGRASSSKKKLAAQGSR